MTDEVLDTPASEVPTPPAAPTPGVALEQRDIDVQADSADRLSELRDRSHPFD